MKRIPIFVVSVLIFCNLSAQDEKTTKGIKFGVTEAQLIEQMLPTIEGVAGSALELLQQQSVKAYMMPVRKAGNNGTDWSYALASCLEYYVNLDKNYKVNLSPDYISLNIKQKGKSASLKEGFSFLSEQGTVNAAIVPFDAATLTEAVYSTQKYKIANYLHLFRDVTPDRQRVYEVRKALMRGNPVLVELKSSASIKDFANTRFWEPSGEADQSYALVVVGYDEVQQAFEVMSSWGRNWGIGGYIWMKYDDFGKYATNGYVILPEY